MSRTEARDGETLVAAMRGHEAVVHFAAESHVDRSIADPARFVSTNCEGTATVCRAALKVGLDRVLHVSTDEVYGSIDVGSFAESDALAPSSPYSASKAAVLSATRFLSREWATKGVRVNRITP